MMTSNFSVLIFIVKASHMPQYLSTIPVSPHCSPYALHFCFFFLVSSLPLSRLCPGLIQISCLHIVCSIILETDPNVIAGKVASNSIDSGAPLSEQVFLILHFNTRKKNWIEIHLFGVYNFYLFPLQTLSQALATAREHLARSLLKWITCEILQWRKLVFWIFLQTLLRISLHIAFSNMDDDDDVYLRCEN